MGSFTQTVLWFGEHAFSIAIMTLLLALGVLITVRSGFYQLRGLPFILKNTVGTLFRRDVNSDRGISPFQAVTTALAGTMGVGNIAGVATALVAGGPGAIFWMWVSAFFGMMTKYAEIFFAVKFRRRDENGACYGGPMYYMEKGLSSKRLACVFSLACTFCALGVGNMTQVNAVSHAMHANFGLPPWASGAAVAAIVALVVFGGVKRIARATELLIPFISIAYLFGAGTFLYIHRHMLGGAFVQIFTAAFALRPAAGGVLGFGVSGAVRLGLARGVFTNEAGLGSAPMAHAAADSKSPGHQAVWGVFEVFLDTIVVCTVTALVLLCAQGGALWRGSGLDGAALTSAAFETVFGLAGGRFIALSIIFFAVSAMLGWCYYGESSVRYLSGGRRGAVNAYRVVFVLCTLPGATADLAVIWSVSDILNALMALPNIIALALLLRKFGIADNTVCSKERR